MPQRYVGVKTFRRYEVLSEREYIERGLRPDNNEPQGELETLREEVDRLRTVVANMIEAQQLSMERLAEVADHWPHDPDLQGLVDTTEGEP